MNKSILGGGLVFVTVLALVFGIRWLYDQDKTGVTEKIELTEEVVREQLRGMPLAFQQNQGQTDPQVKYLMRGSSQSIFFTGDAIVYTFTKQEETETSADQSQAADLMPTPTQMLAIRQVFTGAATPMITGEGELAGKVNYFIGNDKDKWKSGISTYHTVKYAGLYPGVDVLFSGKQGILTYEYTVSSGVSLSSVVSTMEGIDALTVADDGSLALATAFGPIGIQPPSAYQMISEQRVPVMVKYVVMDDFSWIFSAGSFNEDYALIITNE